jgi:suppressor of ftsI
VLRARAVDEGNNPEITSLEHMLNIPPAGCGSQAGELERVFTVNDTLRPRIEIAPHERQFWRIVNAAPDRYVDLQFGDQPFEVVAMDGIPLAYTAPDKPTMKMDHVSLPPGGRVEAIVEGPEQGAHATLRSLCVNTGPDGDWNPGMVLADTAPHSPPDPALYAVASGYIAPAPKTVNLTSYEQTTPDFVATFTEDKNGFYINGEKYRPTSGPMTTARVGTYQHWRIVNDTLEVHPMHIHQVHFLVYSVNGRLLESPLWLDTVNVPVGGYVDVIMDFTNPVIRGMSVFHCHLLNHEDKGMMAKILFK